MSHVLEVSLIVNKSNSTRCPTLRGHEEVIYVHVLQDTSITTAPTTAPAGQVDGRGTIDYACASDYEVSADHSNDEDLVLDELLLSFAAALDTEEDNGQHNHHPNSHQTQQLHDESIA